MDKNHLIIERFTEGNDSVVWIVASHDGEGNITWASNPEVDYYEDLIRQLNETSRGLDPQEAMERLDDFAERYASDPRMDVTYDDNPVAVRKVMVNIRKWGDTDG